MPESKSGALATWRRPNVNFESLLSASRQGLEQGRPRSTRPPRARQARRQCRLRASRLGPRIEANEAAAAGTRSAQAWPMSRQLRQHGVHRAAAATQDGLEGIAERRSRKRSRLLSPGPHPASIQGLGTVRGSARQRPGRRAGTRPAAAHRRQPLADAFGPGIAAVDEDRHVGAQRQPEFGQPIVAQAGVPQLVEHHAAPSRHRKSRRRSRRRAGSRFVHAQVGALAGTAARLQRLRRAQRSGPRLRAMSRCRRRQRRITPSSRTRMCDPVAPVEQLEHGLQLVVAVGATAGDRAGTG